MKKPDPDQDTEGAGVVTPRDRAARDLRKRAEKSLLLTKSPNPWSLSHLDAQRMIHELQVHQVELELQNEELIEARNSAEELQERFAALYDFAPVGYLSMNGGGKILGMNLTASTILGRPRGHIVGRIFQAFLIPESAPVFREFIAEVLWSGERRACEVGIPGTGGEPRFLRLEGAPFHTDEGEVQVQAALIDITDRRRAERELVESLGEKEVLLREIHHRVKNNLQLIASLLDMTRSRSDDPYTQATLADVAMKIHTMAQIHTKVYESQKYDRVDLAELVKDQAKALGQVYADRSREIETTVAAADATLPIDRAVPFALVVNEILSNAFKHAFAGRRQGKIEVTLAERGDVLRLTVQDDGVGMPPGFNVSRSDTLGLKLVRTILERQLKGTLRYGRVRGTEVIVEVPVNGG